jgi:hypothetical protein
VQGEWIRPEDFPGRIAEFLSKHFPLNRPIALIRQAKIIRKSATRGEAH